MVFDTILCIFWYFLVEWSFIFQMVYSFQKYLPMGVLYTEPKPLIFCRECGNFLALGALIMGKIWNILQGCRIIKMSDTISAPRARELSHSPQNIRGFGPVLQQFSLSSAPYGPEAFKEDVYTKTNYKTETFFPHLLLYYCVQRMFTFDLLLSLV